MGTIWQDARSLADHLAYYQDFAHLRVVCTSGGYDCLHCGHLRCIQACKYLGDIVVVIVNGDNFLIRKKGYVFMPLAERMEIIAGITGVDHVIPWDDGSQYVHGALQLLRPAVFAKGGDRSSPQHMAISEVEICRQLGCQIVYGVGGFDKSQSSSELVLRAISKSFCLTRN